MTDIHWSLDPCREIIGGNHDPQNQKDQLVQLHKPRYGDQV